MSQDDTEVESDSPQSISRCFPYPFPPSTLEDAPDKRPKKLPLSHLPPKRTSSQERFYPTGSTPSAMSPARTISTPKDMPFLYNMSDEEINKLPDEIYKQYVKKKADKIVKAVVPESLNEVNNCYSRISEVTPPLIEEEAEGDMLHSYPKQSILYPLPNDQLKVGRDGRYFERRNYNRVEDLGEGGFGMVYACLDTGSEKLFAIKCNSQSDEKKVLSMKRECDVMFKLGQHQNITRFFGSLLEDYETQMNGQSLKMLMECAVNGSLDDMLYDPEMDVYGLAEDQSLYYLQQILHGVNYLHQRDTLHLDLKCKNILVFDEGRTVKLADFGSAVRKEEIAMKELPGGFTPHYSAPEVINGSELISCSADIWSVMCVLVELWTGKMPWCFNEELSQHSVMLLVGNYQEKDNFMKLVPHDKKDLSEEVLALLKKCLIRNSRDRPTATELLNEHIIIQAVQYEKLFYEDEEYDGIEEQDGQTATIPEEHHLLENEECDRVTEFVSLPSTGSSQRISFDSGLGRSLPDRLTSFDSGSSLTGISAPRKPPLVPNTSKYQIFRHESAPFITSVSPYVLKFEEISAHFNSSNNNTIPSNYRPSGLLHSNSAPPEILCNGGMYRLMSRGMEDTERDGPIRQSGLKRTPSAQYVSNGPEVDSPDGRRSLINGGNKLPGAPPAAGSPTSNGMVSVGTQTSLSPTIEGVPPFPGPQTINFYNGSQSSVLHC